MRHVSHPTPPGLRRVVNGSSRRVEFEPRGPSSLRFCDQSSSPVHWERRGRTTAPRGSGTAHIAISARPRAHHATDEGSFPKCVAASSTASTEPCSQAWWPQRPLSQLCQRYPVTLLVDGQDQHVNTSASDVAGVLKGAGYRSAPTTSSRRAPTARSTPTRRSSYNRGRLLHLDVDGKRIDVWTTAPTVGRGAGATRLPEPRTSCPCRRSQRLPLGGTALALLSPKTGPRRRRTARGPSRHDADAHGRPAARGHARCQLDREPTSVVPAADHRGHRGAADRLTRCAAVVTERKHGAPQVYRYRRPARSTMSRCTPAEVHGDHGWCPGHRRVTVTTPASTASAAGRTVRQHRHHDAAAAPGAQVGTKPGAAVPPVPTGGLNWDAVAACESGGNWAHQHRQRLLRWRCSSTRAPGRPTAALPTRPRRPGQPRAADRGRQPAVRRPGLQPVAGLWSQPVVRRSAHV